MALLEKVQDCCSYWGDFIIAAVSIIVLAFGGLLFFNYANADSYSSELSIDCDAISKLKNIEGVTSKNIKSYLLETIKNEALREAVLNDNFDAQQTICDAEAARSASIFDAGFVKIFLAFLVMALGGFGLGYLWIRFRHEWKTWYEPTDGKN